MPSSIRRWNGSTWATVYPDAVEANTANTIVYRGTGGNFSAGTITATLNGSAPAGSLSGNTLASGVTASSLTSIGTLGSLTVSGTVTANGTDVLVPTNGASITLGSNATSGDRLRLHRSGSNTYIDHSGSLEIRPAATTALTIQSNGVTKVNKPSHDYCGVAIANATQSIPNNTWTAINLADEAFDFAGMHDNVTNNQRVLITVPGVYRFDGQVPFDTSTANSRNIRLVKYNTSAPTTAIELWASGSDAGDLGATQNLQVSGLFQCVANDFVVLEAWHDRGSALSTVNATLLGAKLAWELVRATP